MNTQTGILYTKKGEDGMFHPAPCFQGKQTLLEFVRNHHIYLSEIKTLIAPKPGQIHSYFHNMPLTCWKSGAVDVYWRLEATCAEYLDDIFIPAPRLLVGYLATTAETISSALTVYKWGKHPPTVVDLLRLMAVDTAILEYSTSFPDWCERMDLPRDHIDSRKLFNWAHNLRYKIKAFLGKETVYEELMHDTLLGVPILTDGTPANAEPVGS